MFDPRLMSGQRILVTGGGTGLGQAMAEQFLRLGADVAICGRRKAVCDATADVWRTQFPDCRRRLPVTAAKLRGPRHPMLAPDRLTMPRPPRLFFRQHAVLCHDPAGAPPFLTARKD